MWPCTTLRRLDRRATVTVEFALAAPILFTLLAAAGDLGKAVEQSIRLQSVARAGATYATLAPSGAQNSAVTMMTAMLTTMPGASASLTSECRCPASGASSSGPAVDCSSTCTTGMATYVTVAVSAPFTSIFATNSYLPFGALGATSAQIVLRVS